MKKIIIAVGDGTCCVNGIESNTSPNLAMPARSPEGEPMTSIGAEAFYYCGSLETINFRGTEAEWNAITKGSLWDHNTGDYEAVFNYTGQ